MPHQLEIETSKGHRVAILTFIRRARSRTEGGCPRGVTWLRKKSGFSVSGLQAFTKESKQATIEIAVYVEFNNALASLLVDLVYEI